MKFKRIYSICTIIVICAAVAVIQTVAAVPSVDIESKYPGVSQGETFVVNITIDPDGVEIYGIEYKLYFDNNILSIQNQTKGSFLSQDGTNTLELQNMIDNTISRAEYGEARTGVTNGTTTPGILSVLKFKVIGDGVSEFRLFDTRLSDPEAHPISDFKVLSKDSTEFLIQGYVFYKDGSECNNPAINIANINIGNNWNVFRTAENSNSFEIDLAGEVDVRAGDTLQFTVTSPTGNQPTVTDHTIIQEEINNGGLIEYGISLEQEAPVESDTEQSSSSGKKNDASGESTNDKTISETDTESASETQSSSAVSEINNNDKSDGTDEANDQIHDQNPAEKSPGFSMIISVLVLLVTIQIIRVKAKY